MSSISDMAVMALETGLSTLFTAFIAVSVIRFIIDGVRAKREHRNIKTGIKIMFIIAVILAALLVITVIVFMFLVAFGIFTYAFMPR
ncbi:MAG: hypothetical protein IKE92_01805 [Clostridiales bacterium]|nr:hypothetical protein [Clostridiales bacterium]